MFSPQFYDSPKGFPLRSKMMDDFQYLFRIHSAMLKAGFAQDKFRVCLLIAGDEKSSPSIIRRSCVSDAKKDLEYRFVILVTRFGKVS